MIVAVCLALPELKAESGTRSKPPANPRGVVHANRKANNAPSSTKAQGAARRPRHSALNSKSTRNSRSSRSRDARRRSAMRPEAERVKEIQKALAGAGELHQEPTGLWDDATREAMKRYQQRNGFSATGLPDSKSLMKMGLGPHPLPPDVVTPAATSASLNPAATSTALSGPDDGQPTVDRPQEHR